MHIKTMVGVSWLCGVALAAAGCVDMGTGLPGPDGAAPSDMAMKPPDIAPMSDGAGPQPDLAGTTLKFAPRQPMPTPRVDFAVAVHQDRIYTIGGYTGSMSKVVEVYDPAKDTWQRKADEPTARRLAFAATVGDAIYVIGGVNGINTVTYPLAVERYDPATDTWATKSSAPIEPPGNDIEGNQYVAGAAVGDRIYVAIYNTGPSYTTATFAYDPLTDQWNQMKTAGPLRSDEMIAAVIGTKMHVMQRSGNLLGMGQREMAVYDPGTDAWTSELPPPDVPDNRDWAGLVAAGGRLYVIGGFVHGVFTPDGARGTVQSFDPATSQWQQEAPLGTPRAVPGVATVAGRIYVIGGSLTFPRMPVPTGAVEVGSFN